MISGKIILFLCLIAFWKIVWKIFSNVWSNVKWKKEKIRNPLQMQTHHHNPPQTTIKKPTNPPSQQNPLNQTHRNPPQSTAKPTANHHNHEQHRFLAQKHVRARVHREAQWHIQARERSAKPTAKPRSTCDRREAYIRLRPPQSLVTYNPSPPSQDHAGRNHREPSGSQIYSCTKPITKPRGCGGLWEKNARGGGHLQGRRRTWRVARGEQRLLG